MQVHRHWVACHGNSAPQAEECGKWLKDRREEGFRITAMAGGPGGGALYVLSKGTPYTHQVYWVNLHLSHSIHARCCKDCVRHDRPSALCP